MKAVVFISALLLVASSLSLRHDEICKVENQWGGQWAPWNPAGTWNLGDRDSQNIIAANFKSSDNGENYQGTIQYSGEGPIGFRASRLAGNDYQVQNQWGGNSAPWHNGGKWVIGDRDGQRIIALDVKRNGGKLEGTAQYQNEGPIGFRATCSQ